jgi:hypothetical protein
MQAINSQNVTEWNALASEQSEIKALGKVSSICAKRRGLA